MRNFKKPLAFGCCAAAAILIFAVLDLFLYPCTYTRNDVHTLSTQKREVLIMGTSNGKMGIDPDVLLKNTSLQGHNAAAGGEYPQDAYYLLELAREKQDPRVVIYDVDIGYFTTQKEKGNNALLFYHEFPFSRAKLHYFAASMPDSDLRALLTPSYEYPLKTSLPRAADSFRQKIRRDYDVSLLKGAAQEYHENGFIERYPVSPDQFPSINPVLFSREELKEGNLEYLEKMIEFCRNNNIEFVAVSSPLPDALIRLFPENFADGWDFFEEWFADRGIRYFNFNTEFYDAFPHDPLQFTDYEGHLNGDSARAFSGILGDILEQNGIWDAAESAA